MTPIEIGILICGGFSLWQIIRAARTAHLHETTKNLYVSEIECPKCHARPEVPCFFSNGYACSERWEAVRVENIVRKDKRDKANRKP
jgi:hypothetical protein